MGLLEKLGIGGNRKKRPNAPIEFLSDDPLLKNICAVWPDGRCQIAQGYSTNRALRKELLSLKRRKRIPGRLHEETVALEEIARVWGREAQPIGRVATAALKDRARTFFDQAAEARASDVVFENDGTECIVSALVNDSKLRIGHPIVADEAAQIMGFLFHAKDEGSAQTSYQRAEFQGFSIRGGGDVQLPPTVSGLRCQRGPHDPHGDHLFARLFYRDQLAAGMTVQKLGFSEAQAAVFAEIRMSMHGGIFLGGSTGDGKSTTLAVNLALQMEENHGELNLVTLEDPVEYQIPGALQISVPTTGSGDERGDHFRRALMHFCRIHPASGMVSEIRDADAARQVLQAVDTGHQIWTTIHVDNANAILFRLLDMGVEAPAITKPGNVKLLMKQTLLRMLCERCSLAETAERDIPPWLKDGIASLGSVRYRNRAGCEACRRAGTNEISRQAWTGYTRQSVVAEMILPDAGYLGFVSRRDAIGAWQYWVEELGGAPIGRTIWDLVARGLVDPFDALHKGARVDQIAPATKLRLVEGAAP